MRSLLPRFAIELGLPLFEISMVELQIVAYGDGSFQKSHIDRVVGPAASVPTNRRLTAVYYFNRLPKAFSGGELRIYPLMRRPGHRFIDVEPVRNRLVVFPSWARHEVRPVRVPSGRFEDSRFAVNCWIHDRPAQA